MNGTDRIPVTDRRTLITGAAATAAAGIALQKLGSAAMAQEATAEAALPMVPPEFDVDTNWPIQNLDMASTRNTRGSSISSENVSSLAVAWSVPINISAFFGALTGNPVVVDELVYVQDAQSNVYAFDKLTGEEVWINEYNDPVPTGGPNGIAIGYGKLITTLGGLADVLALDPLTGEDLWRTNIKGYLGEGITMAPGINNGHVYVSTIPGDIEEFYQGGMRGIIFSLDIVTGEVIWYFDTTTDNLWGNARVNSGGGLWHPPSFDDEGNLFVGIGNASPYPGTAEFPGASSRPGDNDFANALIRINPDTANYDWYINVKPHDLFDHDNQLSPILADIDVDGTSVPMVFSSGKHGFVVAANQDTGEELWRTAVGEHNENEFLQELGADEEIELLPGFIGGTETPMAFANNLVFAPVLNVPFITTGVSGTGDIFGGVGELTALDAATGEIVWTTPIPTMVLGGATVVNDLVFTGGLDGLVRAYNVADGSLVHTVQMNAGINTSFAVSGDYLYVPAGAPLSPSVDSATPTPELAQEFVALSISGA